MLSNYLMGRIQFKVITPSNHKWILFVINLLQDTQEQDNNGKQLQCPKCQSVRTIYHFNWSGLTCPECKESIDKYDWLVESKGS